MNSKNTLWLAFLTGVVISALTVPTPVQGEGNTETSRTDSGYESSSERGGSASAADRSLEQRIQQTLDDDTSLSTPVRNLRIKADDGRVTLRGTVRSEAEKALIADKVQQMAGVNEVENRLRVADSSKKSSARIPHSSSSTGTEASEQVRRAPTEDGTTQAERDLVARIEQRLNEDPTLSTPVRNLRIKADGGEVTLRGKVSNEEEKKRIAARVREIRGVRAVDNRLRVAESSRLSGSERTSSFPATASPQGSGTNSPQLPGSGEMEEVDRTSSTGPSGSRSFTPSSGAVDPGARAAKPAGDYAVTDVDRDTVAHIRTALTGNPSLSANEDNLHIKVDNGAVTLQGWVESEQAREDIIAQVRQMPGVVSVDDQLRIAGRRSSVVRDR